MLSQTLKDPKKRRQLMIAGGALGVLVLLLVLHKKGAAAAPAEEASSATTAPLSLPAEQAPEGAGGGGGGGNLGSELGGALAVQGANQAAENAQLSSQLAQIGQALSAAYTPPTTPAPEASPAAAPGHSATPLAGANRAVNTQPGNPRQGQSFTAGTYKGKDAHIYSGAVAGGVGPHHNIIITGQRRTRSPSQPPTVASSEPQINSAGGPRAGERYTPGTYKGKRAHIYSRAVRGGVGPHHNIIIL